MVRAAKKSGKRFTGCSRYPACDYVVWAEPHACGHAGGLCLGAEDERTVQAKSGGSAEGAGHGRDADDDVRSDWVVMEARRELGQLEDAVVFVQWGWDADLSLRADHLLILIEGPHP